MRLERKFEWRWWVVCEQTQAFAYPSCEWQYIDSCNHLEHSSKQPQRSIFDRCNFKFKPSYCNLPLSKRCSCDGELLPFTTQNSNSFLTSYKYFWRDSLCVTCQVTFNLKILLCCPCFYPICTRWESWAIVFLMLLSWAWCSFIFVLQMLIQSQDLYESILTEVPIDYRQNLVQVTKYQDGQNCPVIENLTLFILFILIR